MLMSSLVLGFAFISGFWISSDLTKIGILNLEKEYREVGGDKPLTKISEMSVEKIKKEQKIAAIKMVIQFILLISLVAVYLIK